ncbi:MAG: hypothetical protein PVG39_07970 [Desulfobacteraceae bacterium]|jgi:hypothetical protein
MSKISIVSTESGKKEEFLQYYLGDTVEEAEETYLEYESLARKIANSYARTTNISPDDFFAEALTGLARAKRDWEPGRSANYKFKNFAVRKMRDALNAYCRKNNSIVSVPSYVKIASTYIHNIKNVLEKYGINLGIEEVIDGDGIDVLEDSDFMKGEIYKLRKLAENSGVSINNIIERAEFIPSSILYEEGITDSELSGREGSRLAAAIIVGKMEDQMTTAELHVARGIMNGESYAEIGKSYEPSRSVSWVQQILYGLRKKFGGTT